MAEIMSTQRQPADAGSAHMLRACVRRLEEVLDLESDALTENRDTDLPECNRRKSRALLELTRIARTVPASAMDANMQRDIAALRAKLHRNRDLLQVHISAVREVAELLAKVMAETDSDGTYSARQNRPQ